MDVVLLLQYGPVYSPVWKEAEGMEVIKEVKLAKSFGISVSQVYKGEVNQAVFEWLCWDPLPVVQIQATANYEAKVRNISKFSASDSWFCDGIYT